MKCKILFIIILINRMFAAENFKSLEEIRRELNSPNYGPSIEEVLPFKINSKLKVVACIAYYTEFAVDEDYAYSSLSVAGRKFTERFEGVDLENARNLIDSLKNFSNYGDIMIGVFRPNIAIEFVCGDKTFVLNYSEESKAFNLSSPRSNQSLELEHWSRPLLASDKLIIAIKACLGRPKKS